MSQRMPPTDTPHPRGRRILITASLAALVAASGFVGYFLGFRNGATLVGRNAHATSAMILSAIYQRIGEGDYDSAESMAASFADGEILMCRAIETEPLLLQFWSMFPFARPFDEAKIRQHYLHQAFTYFSKRPDALAPEAMAYLRQVGSQEPPMPNPPPSK